MANPHFDRETITEDIGFKGPHFDESIKEQFSLGLPGLAQYNQPQQSWNPGGEFGEQGEFQGWRAKEESIPYRQNWEYGNMPGGEFTTGTNTLSPFRYPQDDVNILERGPGPWNEFNPFDYFNDLFLGADLETDEIMRIMGQYNVGPEEAKKIYDEIIYGYSTV
tara:strand:- start:9 stop:500 length:492 start_codon:yes stop_codon:yes gene_type:complete